ncbi:hypothetical protein KIN20_035232 [Parelaphostrongylus tenuis]|uniref:Guanylate cyclase domain-containing protein n=1 Tax=Parelaphostrongylus tenuis TaxID=148309 RepID=A0AAD5WK97_PARTN|nr:hypothetical protein KIN20_035232 [Parelaphostrongylus tenuis]
MIEQYQSSMHSNKIPLCSLPYYYSDGRFCSTSPTHDRVFEDEKKAYKVETVGDSYVTVGGIPEQIEEHAEIICHVAIGMLWEARSVVEPINKKPI